MLATLLVPSGIMSKAYVKCYRFFGPLQAAGLALSLAKFVLVSSSRLSDAELRAEMRPVLGGDALHIAGHGEYLGILAGPGSPTRYWDAPVAGYSSGCHHVSCLDLPLQDTRLVYQVFTFSVLLFRGQRRAPDRGHLTVEVAARAALIHAPLQAYTVACLASLRTLGAGFAFPMVAHTRPATSMRVALTHPFAREAPGQLGCACQL